MSNAGKWGFSSSGETYIGAYDSREEAIQDGRIDAADPSGSFYVGQYRDPTVEGCVDADLLLEHILCQDDFCGDWAEGSLSASDNQLDELTDAIQKVLGEWIDRHGLRPNFGIVESSEKVEVLIAGRPTGQP